MSDISLGTRQQYSLVVDEEVQKSSKQTNKAPSIGGSEFCPTLGHIFFSMNHNELMYEALNPTEEHLVVLQGLFY